MSEIKIRPLHDQIVVRAIDVEPVSAGGIVLASAEEKSYEGIVLAVGPGVTLPDGNTQPVSVEVGNSILFGQHTGHEVEVDGEDYLLMSEDEIIAILV